MNNYKKNENGLILLSKKSKNKKNANKKKNKNNSKAINYYKKKDLLKQLEQEAYDTDKIDNFHETELNNYILYDKDMNAVYKLKGRPKKDILLKLKKQYPDSKILINIGKNVFKMISFKTYIALSKIQKIVISRTYTRFSPDEDEGDQEVYLTPVIIRIRSMNLLLNFLNNEDFYSKVVYDLTCHDYWYTVFDVHYKILVKMRNDDIKYYKDYDKFLRDFKIRDN